MCKYESRSAPDFQSVSGVDLCVYKECYVYSGISMNRTKMFDKKIPLYEVIT